MNHRREIGAWGEAQAVSFLQRNGFDIIERNYFASVGEIDIIAQRSPDSWYFIEVKTRRIGPLANDLSITSAKKRKFEKTIRHYCYKRNIVDGSFVSAGLLVIFDPVRHIVSFRLAVFC